MTWYEVVQILSDGHSVLTEECAREVCTRVGVAYPETLVMRWQGQQDAFDRYGFLTHEDAPGSGLDSLDVSNHVAEALGLGAPGACYTGRGFRARANARAIVAHFGEWVDE